MIGISTRTILNPIGQFEILLGPFFNLIPSGCKIREYIMFQVFTHLNIKNNVL